MSYQKIGTVIRQAGPKQKNSSRLSKEQIALINNISKVALAIISVAGVVTLAAVAPNIFVAVDKIYRLKGKKLTLREKEIKTARAFYYLKRSGLIKMRQEGQGIKIFLSALGKKRLSEINLNILKIDKPKTWDGKWWQVAADIPTKHHRQSADLLRQKLKLLGFYPLQRTLWFYPYNPKEQLELIINHYGISQFVTLMEISKLDIEDEKILKNYFKSAKIL